MPLSAKGKKEAAALAQTVLQELGGGFAAPMLDGHKTNLVKKLVGEPPSRSQLIFQQEGGMDAPKLRFGSELADDDKTFRELFCMAHAEFVLLAGADIEHAVAHSQIRERQTKLMARLNADPEFADEFLSQPGISDYIRRDPDDGHKVKGTAYFYKMCYNAEGNLWLLCHACNIKKGAGDAMPWFQRQPLFGDDFVADVGAGGGLHEGVIIDRIYEPDADDLSFDMGDGSHVSLHTASEGVGLGAFVRDWFMEKHGQLYEAHKQFYGDHYGWLKGKINEILDEAQEVSDPSEREAFLKTRYTKLQKDLKKQAGVRDGMAEAADGHSSSDESASSLTGRIRHDHQVTAGKVAEQASHDLGRVVRFIEYHVGKAEAEELCQFSGAEHQLATADNEWEGLHTRLQALDSHGGKVSRESIAKLISAFRGHLKQKDSHQRAFGSFSMNRNADASPASPVPGSGTGSVPNPATGSSRTPAHLPTMAVNPPGGGASDSNRSVVRIPPSSLRDPAERKQRRIDGEDPSGGPPS